MRTIVYVDGFNFYHGLVKRSGYKWLDLYKLFEEQLLPIRARESQLIKVKFFTAEIKAKFATRGEQAHQAQQAYHRALLQIYGDKIEIIKGYYSERQECAMTFNQGCPPSKTDRTTVWKLEEKQTDVRMALEMYRDAVRGEAEQLVLCTNDSDMIPPIEMIKADRPELKIGIVVPREQDTNRVISSLAGLGDWSLPYVSYEALRLALLPDKVPTRRKPILKPNHW